MDGIKDDELDNINFDMDINLLQSTPPEDKLMEKEFKKPKGISFAPIPLNNNQDNNNHKNNDELVTRKLSLGEDFLNGNGRSLHTSSPRDRKNSPGDRWSNLKKNSIKQITIFLKDMEDMKRGKNDSNEDITPLNINEELYKQIQNWALYFLTKGDAHEPLRKIDEMETHHLTKDEKVLVMKLKLIISSITRLDEYNNMIKECQKNNEDAYELVSSNLPQRKNSDVPSPTSSPRMISPRLSLKYKSINMLPFSQSLDQKSFLLSLKEFKEKNKEQNEEKNSDDTVTLCRTCETFIENNIFKEHTKVCSVKSQYDLKSLRVDEEIKKIRTELSKFKFEELSRQNIFRQILSDINAVTLINAGLDAPSNCNVAIQKITSNVRSLKSVPQEMIQYINQITSLIEYKKTLFKEGEIISLQSPRFPVSNNNIITKQHKKPSIKDFKIIKPITRGGYGSVYLARKKVSNDLFAVKILSIEDMVQRKQINNVMAERNILAKVQSDFVVKMFFCMKSKKYLYFVMEFMKGGDCYSLLKGLQSLDEEVARFYIAETLLALEDIHKYGIIHRDLKPDNILIGENGHIKLADFGLSKVGLFLKHSHLNNLDVSGILKIKMSEKNSHQTTKDFLKNSFDIPEDEKSESVVGTPYYLAPEVLLEMKHGPEVDFFALGVVLFEFLVGVPPFQGETAEDVFEKIIINEISWPEEENIMSPEAKDLIMKLLEPNPKLRFGAKGFQEIKDHVWFKEIDFANILKTEPPFIPNKALESDEDLMYIEGRQDDWKMDEDLKFNDESGDDLYNENFHHSWWFINLENLEQMNNNQVIKNNEKRKGSMNVFSDRDKDRF
eukprot:TRINITY_DN4269_c0_g1_i1.p1 TRINITY_DN4269_c0_g1~~TRINITY_DN4269_c0_g1_i1.p1  ORF type:complete len:900 (-),score=286.24 TRINITY_DN4269_c0_g1_i1:81-2591(-)